MKQANEEVVRYRGHWWVLLKTKDDTVILARDGNYVLTQLENIEFQRTGE